MRRRASLRMSSVRADLVLVAGLHHLHDGGGELGDAVAQPAGGGVGGLADLLPRGRPSRAVGLGDVLGRSA